MTVTIKLKNALPEWETKGIWDATAQRFRVKARNEADAWDKTWKKISRMEGGSCCLKVEVIRKIEGT